MNSFFVGKWNFPTEIHFSPGELDNLADHCMARGIRKPLIVTDQMLVHMDFFNHCMGRLSAVGMDCDVFSAVKPNPTGGNVNEGVKKLNKHQCDGVVAIGGGSALDAGKAVALMARQTRDLFEFEDVGDNWQKVNEDAMVPCIAVPTTAGTGSEVGRSSVIVDEKAKSKKIIFHPDMTPCLVIADPKITMGLPAKLTAATGIDAFVHSFEAFCVPAFHPMADGIAVEGMRMVWKWLQVAYLEPENLEARSKMLVASSMGATAFQKGLGSIHALAHPLGAVYDAHHGLLNAILLPYIVKANQKAIEERTNYLCSVFQLQRADFSAFLDALLAWRQTLAIPHSLKEIGIDTDNVEMIAAAALADPCNMGNPVRFDQKKYMKVLSDAVEGVL